MQIEDKEELSWKRESKQQLSPDPFFAHKVKTIVL
jgi:hypothetical protein